VNASEPPVAAVVLAWNRKGDTLACLRALARTTYAQLRTIVVDNGSTDGTSEAVAAAFPEAVVVRSEVNLGFAGGNNLGLEQVLESDAAYAFVLNNDVLVEEGAVAALVAEAERHADVAALNPKILFADPPGRIWFAGASFDPRRGYNGRQHGYGKPDGPQFASVAKTDRVCGAALLIPRAALEEVGLFDADLFLYSEDTEWSLRARAAGRRLLVVPAARVVHAVSASSGGESSPATIYYGLRNTITVCERAAPLGPLGTWRRRLVALAAHVAQAVASPRRGAALRAVRDGWRDARSGRLGPRPEVAG
jgi:hypothetical protein